MDTSLSRNFLDFHHLFSMRIPALVAPFFTDIDISRGVGQIIYENHTLSTSKDLISRVDYIINEQTQANFKGKWMLVATWEDVPQFGSDYNIVRFPSC